MGFSLMPQTSFPPSAVFGTGPFVVGRTTANFGLASALEVKTINGESIFGSGDLSVSASPGGETTQIQLNSSGSFGGTSRLTWTDANGMAVGTDSESQVVFRITPPSDSAYQYNVPLTWTAGPGVIQTGVGTLASGISAYNFGANLELGGSGGTGNGELWSLTHPAIGIRLESNYLVNRREFNERYQEFHLTHTPIHNSSNTTAGSHVRFMSFEVATGFDINGGANQPMAIGCYISAGAFDLRLPKSTSNGAVYLSAGAGTFNLSDSNGVLVNSFSIAHDATYTQFTCTGTFIFQKGVFCQSTLGGSGKLEIQNTGAADAAVIYGGITAGGEIYSNAQGLKSTKSVTANNSFALYSYATYGTPTTQPAALTGAIQLIVVENGGNLELRALGPTGATDLISTLAAS